MFILRRRSRSRKKINIWKLSSKRADFRKRKLSNPFFPRKKIKFPGIYRFSKKTKFIIIGLAILITSLFWLFFISPIFSIKKITVNAVTRIPIKEIENLAWEQTTYMLGLEKNIFLFDKKYFINNLNDKYYLDELTVDKSYHGVITINFKEKTQAAVWHEADKYYYIDSRGNIIGQIDPLNLKQKNLPLIDNLGQTMVDEKTINYPAEKLTYIIDLFGKFKKEMGNLSIERFIIDKDIDTVKLLLIGGPSIYFNIRDELDKQISKLLIIKDKTLKDDFMKKSYIDIRYGDRIYYR